MATKATISELWETGREIITYSHSELERPTTITDLKKCENVIVGEKCKLRKAHEVLIDNTIYYVAPGKSFGIGGSILFLEII